MVSFKKLRQMIEVKGNGNIVSREISVSSFIRLHIGGRGLVELYQSDEEKVIIETDENLQEYFEAGNSGRTLYVSAGAILKKPVYTKCIIRIYCRQIDVLYIRNEQGDLICPNEISLINPLKITIQTVGNTSLNINAPSIKMLCQAEGNISMKGKCESIEIKNQSQGDFFGKELLADKLTIKNMAQGNVELFAEKEIRISHFGEGYIHYYGNAVLKDVKQYGHGEIKHMNK
jgi:hypothetical protein